MGILVDNYYSDDSYDKKRNSWNIYKQYLESIKDKIPKSALEFALADWHYNLDSHQCLHDSWVESLTIHEPAKGDRKEIRKVDIELKLLGPFHDGNTVLQYKNVQAYQLLMPNNPELSKYREESGHGDFIIDDISLSFQQKVIHSIIFRWQASWHIECDDIIYSWHPF